jgi:hypothetical protein
MMKRETREIVVRLTGVTKTYQVGASEVAALRGIGFEFKLAQYWLCGPLPTTGGDRDAFSHA